MARYVIVSDGSYRVHDGVVAAGLGANVIEWDGETPFAVEGGSLVPEGEFAGMFYVAPPAPPPFVVAKWQLQVVLASMPHAGGGTLLDAANALAAQVGGVAAIAWAGASEITRASPLLNELAPALGLSDADVDAIFVRAAGVVA